MSIQDQQSFSIKCQCSAYKNDILITSKKKSKLSNLVLNYTNKTLSIVPLNSKEQNIIFQLKKLRHIHRKFIQQGKITLEFLQQSEKIPNSKIEQNEENKTQRLSRIFVQAASPQNLQLLIKKIVDTKQLMKSQTKSLNKKQNNIEKEHMNKQTSEDQQKIMSKPLKSQVSKKRENNAKSQRMTQNLANRKRDPTQNQKKAKQFQNQKSQVKISRKTLMNQIHFKTNSKDFPLKQIVKEHTTNRSQADLLQLPSILLEKILQFTKLQLKHRLINKKFDKFVLLHIQNLHFKDQVDEATFNKLAKYTPNIKGRLKNVRNLQLIDQYNQPQLQKNRAKSLYFGQWKQISKKNILQIKGLHLHTLQIPYQIKFQLHNLFEINLRQFHLYSRYQVLTPNSFITDENIIYLFKHAKLLEAFSIPYINSSVLEDLSVNFKEKIKEMKYLKFGSINQNCKKQQSWFLFHVYQQLKYLSIERVLKGGLVRRDARYNFTFPLFINTLQIGPFVSEQTISSFPTTLTKLKLIGQIFYNSDIEKMFLPYLKCLDLTQCPRVRPAVLNQLQQCSNLKIITTWQKYDIDLWKQTATNKGIQLISIKGVIIRK